MMITDPISVILRYKTDDYIDLGFFFTKGLANIAFEIYYMIKGYP